MKEVLLIRMNLKQSDDSHLFLNLCHEYFNWMDCEIKALCGFSIASIVKMSLSEYVAFTASIAAEIGAKDGGIYLLQDNERNVVAMGGLRRLPSGHAEIVRIYTRPEYRGHGYGEAMVSKLIGEARRLKYQELFLDTGIFMKSAQRIYSKAGFLPSDPYDGAEPPDALKPFWLYMRKKL